MSVGADLKREADLVMLGGSSGDMSLSRTRVRGQNFLIEWVEARAGVAPIAFASDDEIMLLSFDTGVTLSGAAAPTEIARRSLAVLPGGSYRLTFREPGRCCILSTSRRDDAGTPLNAGSYARPDRRVAPIGPAWRRTGDPKAIQAFEIDKVAAPADNPRLKMFQSATMSINWVDYQGQRNRAALSPHSHADFEQASLAAAGEFVHHLRAPWGKNADEWHEDKHLRAGSPSVLVIPPDLIHTTEGVGGGHHLLIDVFAPPRRDFISKGWMLNAREYRDPLQAPV
jgi:hypothetical protein